MSGHQAKLAFCRSDGDGGLQIVLQLKDGTNAWFQLNRKTAWLVVAQIAAWLTDRDTD